MMKASRTFQTAVAVLVLGMEAVTGRAQDQTYQYSGPINGSTQIGLDPGFGYSGSFNVSFGSVSETLDYNPSAGTIQEIGTVTLNPSSGSFNMTGGPFGPVGSANLTVGNGGSFSFDTIFSAEKYGGAAPEYPLFTGDLLVPVSGSGTYGGQSFSGSWDVVLPLEIEISAANATSLDFDEVNFGGGPFYAEPGQTVIPGLGLQDGTGGDNTYYYSWNQDPIGMGVPDDSSSVVLLGIAISSLAFLRRR